MTSRPRGLFIVLEGLDRCGKSTQIELTRRFLQTTCQYANVEEWNFPDRSTTIGQSCDLYLRNKQNMNDKAIHLMFSANRWEKENTIKSLIASGTSIVCGRYAYSGVAYSGAKGMPMDWCRGCDVGLPEPDLVIFLDMDPEVAATRSAYGEERYEKVSFQKVVREKFMEIFSWDNRKVCLIDASQSIEKVQNDIQQAINQKASVAMNEDLGELWKNINDVSKRT